MDVEEVEEETGWACEGSCMPGWGWMGGTGMLRFGRTSLILEWRRGA
jgi:hypothetical protein